MVTRAESALEWPGTRPDPEYALVAGCYVAALLGPVVLIVLAPALTGAAAFYVGLLVAVTVIGAGAGLGISRRRDVAIRLGRHAAIWVLAVLPIPWFAGILVGVELVGDPPAVAGAFALLGGTAATLLGLLLARMSRNRYATARLATVETIAQWEARWPRTWRRGAVGVATVATVLGLAAIAVGYLYDVEVAGRFYVLLYVWAPVAGVANPRTYRITDAGLVLERPLSRAIRPWSSITGYALTDGALVVSQRGWWRPALRSDRADLEDVDAVVDALDRYIDRE